MAKLWFSKTKLATSDSGWTEFKTPTDLTISPEKIWSSDTGRGDDGTMQGSVVAVKTTLKITWAKLTSSQIRTLDSFCTRCERFYVKFIDPASNDVEKVIEVYAGTPSYTVLLYNEQGGTFYNGIAVDLIEW